MNKYITDKYAGMLTEEDVAFLFNSLAKELGDNRSEAARQCGVTGKATYDWDEAAYVKLGTKKKVLSASLRSNFLGTAEYLFNRSTDRSVDLLRTILSTLYANALEAASIDDFKTAFAKFESIRTRHLGMIRDGIQNEVTDMTTFLKDKAKELEVPISAKRINEFSAEETLNAIQLIGHVYSENPIQAEVFAKQDVGIPEDFLKPVIETFRNLCLVRNVQTNATDEAHKIVKQRLITTNKLPWTTCYLAPATPEETTWMKHFVSKHTEGGITHEVTTRA